MTQITTVTQATAGDLLTKMGAEFKKALPENVPIERFMRVALTDFRDNPKLSGCDSKSFLGSLMMCAQLGLEPGKGLGHAYIIPYGNKATFVLGYRGMIELIMRGGKVSSISAHEVYENDTFEFEFGLNEKLIHRPAPKDRGSLVYVYGIARLVDGGYAMDVMSKDEIDNIRKRSKTGNFGPWATDYPEMAKKTVIRRMFKYLPVAIQSGPIIQRAVIADEAGDRGEQQEYLPDDFQDVLGEEEQPHIKSITEQVSEVI